MIYEGFLDLFGIGSPAVRGGYIYLHWSGYKGSPLGRGHGDGWPLTGRGGRSGLVTLGVVLLAVITQVIAGARRCSCYCLPLRSERNPEPSHPSLAKQHSQQLSRLGISVSCFFGSSGFERLLLCKSGSGLVTCFSWAGSDDTLLSAAESKFFGTSMIRYRYVLVVLVYIL